MTRSIEEALYHMPTVAKLATNEWAKSFAESIVKQSRRRGWRPSAKQQALMQRMVSELFTRRDDGGALIE
ncbi:MAG: hypothetical protein INF93_08425 [Rhodobacter sp.]|nr:hypothetical protein [Rhodobacter sp.]